MLDAILRWAIHYPLWTVIILAAFAVLVGFAFVPLFHELSEQRHPRC